MERITDLLIPVNPKYDFAGDPSGQAEYVNPVTLNNMEIKHANAAILVADRVTGHMVRLAKFKADRDDAQNDLDDFEADLLRLHPAPPNDRKTNKLLDSYIRRIAEQEGQLDHYKGLIDKVRKLDREITVTDAAVDAGRQVSSLIKMLGEHGQTHLSFVKNEYRQSKSYT